MIRFYLKLALRNLLHNKVYSFLIIIGFSIGFAACILIGLFYQAETTVNHGFNNHSLIYRLYDVKKNRCNLNWDLYPVLASDYASVEDACPLDYQDGEFLPIIDVESQKYIQVKQILATTNNFFSIFSVSLNESISGKPFEDKESIAISRKLSETLFGEMSPLGRQINIGNYFLGTVTSVFNALPGNSSFNADIILNSENEKFRFSHTISNGFSYNPTNLFIKLRPGTETEILARDINRSQTLKQLDVDSLAFQSLDDIYLSDLTIKSRHAKGNPGLLKIFLAIATLILMLSSINYINYSVSMQYSRLRNTGIRLTFGEGREDIVEFIFFEVILGIAFSLLLAVFITDLALPFSERLFGKSLEVKWENIIAVTPYFLMVVVVVAIINSLTPLYILSKFSVIGFLTGSGRRDGGRQLWKQVLLTFQLTVSIILFTVGAVIYKQLGFVRHSDAGFDKEKLMRIDIPYKFSKTEALRSELENLSFVSGVTLSSGCPGMINHKMDSEYEGKSTSYNCIYVGDNYLQTMGINLLEGRDFLEGDLNKACFVNEEAVKQNGWLTIEGKRFNNGQEGGFEIIGVVNNFKFESYHNTVEPLALLFTKVGDGLFYLSDWNVLSLKFSSGNVSDQVQQIKQVWEALSPNEPISFIFYDDLFQSFYMKEEQLAGSITFFTVIALALTCMGILGQIFMICLGRVKEIGIRKINGSTISEIFLLLNSDIVKWFVLAFCLATPLSYFIASKWLGNFAYKTSLDWWIFVIPGVLVLSIVLFTVSWQSISAATRNPVKALRYE